MDGQTGTCLGLFHQVFSTSLGDVVVIDGGVSVLMVRVLLRLRGLSWSLLAQVWFGVEILRHAGVSLQMESTLVTLQLEQVQAQLSPGRREVCSSPLSVTIGKKKTDVAERYGYPVTRTRTMGWKVTVLHQTASRALLLFLF